MKAFGAGGLTQPPIIQPIRDVRMDTAKAMTLGDVKMETARGTTWKKTGPNLQLWERELVASPEVKRKATVAQLCECDRSRASACARSLVESVWLI